MRPPLLRSSARPMRPRMAIRHDPARSQSDRDRFARWRFRCRCSDRRHGSAGAPRCSRRGVRLPAARRGVQSFGGAIVSSYTRPMSARIPGLLRIAPLLALAACAYAPPNPADTGRPGYQADLAACQTSGDAEAHRLVMSQGGLFLTYPISSLSSSTARSANAWTARATPPAGRHRDCASSGNFGVHPRRAFGLAEAARSRRWSHCPPMPR